MFLHFCHTLMTISIMEVYRQSWNSPLEKKTIGVIQLVENKKTDSEAVEGEK